MTYSRRIARERTIAALNRLARQAGGSAFRLVPPDGMAIDFGKGEPALPSGSSPLPRSGLSSRLSKIDKVKRVTLVPLGCSGAGATTIARNVGLW